MPTDWPDQLSHGRRAEIPESPIEHAVWTRAPRSVVNPCFVFIPVLGIYVDPDGAQADEMLRGLCPSLLPALMAVFRVVSDLFRALQLQFLYQVKYMTSHIVGSLDDRTLENKTTAVALVKNKEG